MQEIKKSTSFTANLVKDFSSIKSATEEMNGLQMLNLKGYDESPCAYSELRGGNCTNDCMGCPEAETRLVDEVSFCNLTPHAVTILDRDSLKEKYTINPSGCVARCEQSTATLGRILDIPITGSEFYDVAELPDEEYGVYYIVSRLVLEACKDRRDLLVPNEIQKDENNRIIGCLSFAKS